MSEERCPMCSSPNPETAEECAVCGARLMPLVADSSPPESSPSDVERKPPMEGEGEELGADWLDRIRAEVVSDPAPEEVEKAPPGADDGSPEWLGQLREADSGADEGPPEGEIPDWMEDFAAAGDSDEAEDVPDWLARIRARKAAVPGSADSDQGGEDWLADLRADEKPEEAPSRLDGLAPSMEADEETPEEEPAPPLDLGALSSLPAVPGSPDLVSETAGAELSADQGAAPRESSPGEAGEDPSEGSDSQVPPLVLGEGGEKPVVEIDDITLESIELPDWIGEMKPDSEEGEGASDLAPATLPTWLEAMRPVDSFRSDIEIEPEEVQPIEAAGPLAGLRGVLMAEPVVAIPRTSTASASRLEVTERQYAQAELLHRLVEEEQREVGVRGAERVRVPLVRWVIALVLCLAVITPFLFERLGIEGFSLPSVVPRDLGPLIALVETVPTDRPMLVVFDYAPGYSGELATVSSPLLTHAAQRAIPIVTVSTRPTGPPLAELNVQNIDAGREMINGTDYVHLGYLSGGSTAVQLFAIAPREQLLRGFRLPEDFEGSSGWDSPILEGVDRLSDFGSVVVITAGTETARTWAEQTNPWIGETPLIMILSAGAEPLVRPYFEAPDKQVDGILTGLPSAVTYEQFNGTLGDARLGWDAFGMGMIAIQALLLVGAGYGIVNWLAGTQRIGRRQDSA
jgi:hypothetical protein